MIPFELTKEIDYLIADAVKYQQATNISYIKGLISCGLKYSKGNELDSTYFCTKKMELLNLEMILNSSSEWNNLLPNICNSVEDAIAIIHDGEAHGFEFKIQDGRILYREKPCTNSKC